MAYIAGGNLRDKRPWSFSLIVDYFWGFLGSIYTFILTMFSMQASDTYGRTKKTGGRPGGGGPGGGGGGWGPGGGGRGGRGGMDNVRGIDHSAPTPACGSCCG